MQVVSLPVAHPVISERRPITTPRKISHQTGGKRIDPRPLWKKKMEVYAGLTTQCNKNYFVTETTSEKAPSTVQPLNEQGVLRISRMDGLTDDDLSQKIRIRNRKTPLTFATWNVRSLHRDSALEDLVAETTRYNIDVTAIQEMRPSYET